MARAGSINYQVSNIIKSVNGIGTSKKENRDNSGVKSAESGHKISDKVHSYKSLDNLRDNLTNLAKYAKSEHQIKDMSKIDSKIIGDWIKSKEIIYHSASNYLSEINKVSDHLSISREEVKTLRAELRKELPTKELTTRYYKNLDRVQMPDRSQPAFELQRDYGLRVSASTSINLDKQLDGNILKYQEKGGKWSEKELSSSLVSKIKENAVNGKYEMNNRTYTRDLKEAIESQTKNIFNGTHGIRHSYAQNQLEAGKSKAEVTQSMGHSREEITNTYLR